ncbi:hypothetical protein EV426DRAFT_703120 [Tirmania nivea]|nr:hypothetical protein EV426DRAFT_703120 [Tirmania nivea]
MPAPRPVLDALRRQYLQLLAPADMTLAQLPPSLLLDQAFQHALYTHLFSPDCARTTPPPPRTYTARVVKRLIAAIEEEAWKEGYACPEIDEVLIDFYAALLATIPASTTPLGSAATAAAHVTYTIAPPASAPAPAAPAAGASLTLLESRSVISSAGHTGSRTWEASLALGELLISSHHRTPHPLTFPPAAAPTPFTAPPLPHKRVLELGAGTGFLSILCAKLGALSVLATDGDWRVCAALRGNVAANRVSGVVSVRRLLWGSGGVLEDAEDADQREGSMAPDIVLAADVTYDTAHLPSLAHELQHILTQQNPHAHVLVAATVRNPETFAAFLRELGNSPNSVQTDPLLTAQIEKEHHSLAWASALWTPHAPRILYYATAAPIRILRITAAA